MQRVNLIPPNMPTQSYRTYSIVAPVATHFRPGTCEEADCENYKLGFKVVVDPNTELGKQQMHYLDADRSRSCIREMQPTGLIEYIYGPGQTCFAQHKVRIDRPEIFVVRDGHFQNPTGGSRTHTKPEYWVEDFAEHQDKLATVIERG